MNMTPRGTPALAVTPLEDRCLAVNFTMPPIVTLAPSVGTPVIQVFQPVAPSGGIYVGTGAVGIMGIRLNHNETFVRRRRGGR